jgi:hypothetical protein
MSQKFHPGDGTTGLSTRTGFTINADAGLSQPAYPFEISVSGTKLSVSPGTLNNLIPVIGGTSQTNLLIATPTPTLTIAEKGTIYIYVKCGPDGDNLAFPSSTLGANGYPQIISSSSQLKNDDTAGYLLLGTVVDGKVSQFIQNSLGCERHKFSQPNSSVYYFWRI